MFLVDADLESTVYKINKSTKVTFPKFVISLIKERLSKIDSTSFIINGKVQSSACNITFPKLEVHAIFN